MLSHKRLGIRSFKFFHSIRRYCDENIFAIPLMRVQHTINIFLLSEHKELVSFIRRVIIIYVKNVHTFPRMPIYFRLVLLLFKCGSVFEQTYDFVCSQYFIKDEGSKKPCYQIL